MTEYNTAEEAIQASEKMFCPIARRMCTTTCICYVYPVRLEGIFREGRCSAYCLVGDGA